MKAGLVLCDYHADKLGMRDADMRLLKTPREPRTVLMTFAPSTEAVPDGAGCDATQGDDITHDGALRMYTLQQVGGRKT